MTAADNIVLLDERKDAETFTDNRPVKKDLDVELKEKGIEFDLSNMSYEDAMQTAMNQAMFARASLLGQRINMGTPTPEQLDELLALSSPSALENLYSQAREQMAKIIKKIPRDWFVSSAPKDLALDNPDTYKMLRANRANEVRQLISRAEKDAKN